MTVIVMNWNKKATEGKYLSRLFCGAFAAPL